MVKVEVGDIIVENFFGSMFTYLMVVEVCERGIMTFCIYDPGDSFENWTNTMVNYYHTELERNDVRIFRSGVKIK